MKKHEERVLRRNVEKYAQGITKRLVWTSAFGPLPPRSKTIAAIVKYKLIAAK